MAINKAYLNAKKSPASDECYTPRYGVIPIIKHLKAKGYKKIWCPFDNSKSMFVRVLQAEGFIVYNSHLDAGYNFLDYTPRFFDFDCIVSNPPFSIKDIILKRLYELKKPFCILLPQNTLQSKARVKMFMEHGIEYLGFDGRIGYYTRQNYDACKPWNHFASGYFCKNVLPLPLQFEKLTPIQEPYYD